MINLLMLFVNTMSRASSIVLVYAAKSGGGIGRHFLIIVYLRTAPHIQLCCCFWRYHCKCGSNLGIFHERVGVTLYRL